MPENRTMQQLDLQTICGGMTRVRDNASGLLEDAKLLRQSGRISRAYALAYMACEEAGKLSILLGAATQIVVGIPVDWKALRKRFHSHDSKASQFLGLARAIPMIQQAAAAGQKTVDVEELMIKASVGVIIGPALFEKRNASIYCNFTEGSFTSPSEEITESMADLMIENADTNLFAANKILGKSAEETAAKIAATASRARYDKVMSYAADMSQTIEAVFRKPDK
jgi:AbiV family abortive infection protein